MPNWVYNTLIVTGKDKDVKDFVKATTSEVPVCEYDKNMKEVPTGKTEQQLLDFNKIIPMPEELRGTTSPASIPIEAVNVLNEKYGASDWYQWSKANWGTKWNACHVSMEKLRKIKNNSIVKGCVCYKFDTAWSAPIPVLTEMGVKFPNLSFEYACVEEDNSFAGRMLIENGEVTSESCYNRGEDGFEEIARELRGDDCES
jgi:hypothetical protein